MLPHERFDRWRATHERVLVVFQVTRGWPIEERYGLTAQARRAAFSAAANIAEGSAKHGRREFRRFLDISIGSLSELAYVFRLAHDLELSPTDVLERAEELRASAGRMVWGLYRSLKPLE